ncbi:MAG: type II secretion system protein [Candidatus Eremiobacteraeota bacterium]|nr:type II secretion system protein [Candidatus Eremiobacteraeota bacterium]MCW5870322.1 type II secretion system protein [Candidatus Eremiobacteraeota bacterium]
MLKRGFTILETLITITLVSLVFGMFVLLLRDSFQLSRRMASKDEARRVTQVALDRMLTEAREADEILAGPNNRLNLTKVIAQDDVRCPAPLSYPLPDGYGLPAPPSPVTFSPFEPSLRRQVLYRLSASGSLLRETGPVGGAVSNGLELASGLTGLRCEWAAGPPLLNQRLLVIVLTYLDGKHLRPIKGMVVCPGIRRN